MDEGGEKRYSEETAADLSEQTGTEGTESVPFAQRETVESKWGIASLVLGIVAIASENFVCGILAIVFSNKQKAMGENGMSKAGKILGIISIALAGFFLFLAFLNVFLAMFFDINIFAMDP